MDCATGVHVIRRGGYINGSDNGLTTEKRRVDVCKIDVKCKIANKHSLAFLTKYFTSYESEEILNIGKNYPPQGTLQKL